MDKNSNQEKKSKVQLKECSLGSRMNTKSDASTVTMEIFSMLLWRIVIDLSSQSILAVALEPLFTVISC